MSLYNDKVIKAAIQEIGSLLSKTTLSEAERKKLLAGKINYVLNYETARYVAQQEELINECITQGLTLDLVTAQHKFFVNSDITMEIIASSSDAMNEIVNSETAMNEIVNSEIAMNEIVNSETAVNKCINSSIAMDKILNSQYRDLFLDSPYLDPNNAADATARETVRNWLLNNPDIFNDNSIVAYYPFEGNANDYSGNGYHGTWSGTEQYDTGRSGQAAKFDGNSYVETGLDINGLSAVTFMFSLSYTSSSPTKIMGFSGSNDMAIEMSTSPTTCRVYFRSNLNYSDVSNFFINDGSWHIYSFIIDSVGTKHFRDVAFIADSSQAIATVSLPFRIGEVTDNGGNNYYFTGLIDSVRIFNRALTNTEIQRLYKLEMLARN